MQLNGPEARALFLEWVFDIRSRNAGERYKSSKRKRNESRGNDEQNAQVGAVVTLQGREWAQKRWICMYACGAVACVSLNSHGTVCLATLVALQHLSAKILMTYQDMVYPVGYVSRLIGRFQKSHNESMPIGQVTAKWQLVWPIIGNVSDNQSWPQNQLKNAEMASGF